MTGAPWAVVLAGGGGNRAAAMTRDALGRFEPKQFLSFDGGPRMVRWALERARRAAPAPRQHPGSAPHPLTPRPRDRSRVTMRQQRMPQPTLRPRRQAGAPPGEPAAGAKPWHVYLLRCADGTLYAGSTTDVEARAAAHNSGRGARYTSSRRPVSVVYQEDCGSRSAALKREHALKRLTRSAKDALIAGTLGLKPQGSIPGALSARRRAGIRRP